MVMAQQREREEKVYVCRLYIIIYVCLSQGCPIFAMEGQVYAGFHSNLSLHLLISLISSLLSDWRCVN